MQPEPKREQLHMLWPKARLDKPPRAEVPDGYQLCTFEAAHDTPGYLALMHSAGFTCCDEAFVQGMLQYVLPDGFLLIAHLDTQELVATAMAQNASQPWSPGAGAVGWVAASAAHSGRGLGRAVCSAAVARLIEAGFRCIYLQTDDWRLPAIRTYLRMGFVPFLFAPDMAERWRVACEQVSWPYTPDEWPSDPSQER